MPHKTIIRLSGVARNPANGFPARLLGLEVTTNYPKAKNLARICFLGYDPDIGIADSAALLAMHVDLKSKAPPAFLRRRTRARAATPPAGPNEESVEGEYVALPKFMGPSPGEWLEACPWLQERGFHRIRPGPLGVFP